jgi:hypothetical protein
MRKLGLASCAIALLGAGTALAADSGAADGLKAGPYVGVDAGWIGYHDNVDGVSIDLSGFTYSPFVGYQLNKYVALEGSYLGTTNASTTVDGVDVNVKTHGVQAALLGTLPLSPIGGLYARAGLLRWHSTVSSAVAGVSDSENGTDGLYGLGAYLTNNQGLTGRLEATTASINGTRIYRVTLGGYWSF